MNKLKWVFIKYYVIFKLGMVFTVHTSILWLEVDLLPWSSWLTRANSILVACKIKKKPKDSGAVGPPNKKQQLIILTHYTKGNKGKKIVLPDAFDAILLWEPEDDDGCSACDTARFSDLISAGFAPLVAAVPPEDDFEIPLALDDFLDFDDAVVICEGWGV